MPDDRKAKSVGKKIFNYGQDGTNITTKHELKHGLYTMLCNRFNVAQRFGYVPL